VVRKCCDYEKTQKVLPTFLTSSKKFLCGIARRYHYYPAKKTMESQLEVSETAPFQDDYHDQVAMAEVAQNQEYATPNQSGGH
jgi:hypothetical protein